MATPQPHRVRITLNDDDRAFSLDIALRGDGHDGARLSGAAVALLEALTGEAHSA